MQHLHVQFPSPVCSFSCRLFSTPFIDLWLFVTNFDISNPFTNYAVYLPILC